MEDQGSIRNSYIQASGILLAFEARIRSIEPTSQVLSDLESMIVRLHGYPKTIHRDILIHELTRFFNINKRKYLRHKE